jgi:predicted  nucleic acid-binding Zn-ribbon protein
MAKLNKRKCKNCGEVFQKKQPLQYICSPKCGAELARKNTEKKQAEDDKVMINNLKEKIKGIPELKKDLEREINTIVRLIDKGVTCISCSALGNSAGHFHSVKSNGAIRFNLHNIHIQEYSCNGMKGGNDILYGKGLIEVYGKEYKEYCEYDLVRLYPVLKLHKHELKEAIALAKTVVKHLKLENKEYTPVERKELRTKLNKIIGIYN